MDEFVKNAESYIKNYLGFKRKYLSDKSGYWFEKTYKTKFFSVHIVTEPGRGYIYVELSSPKEFSSPTYQAYIKVYDRQFCRPKDRDSQQIFQRNLRDVNSYWKKFNDNNTKHVQKLNKKYKR